MFRFENYELVPHCQNLEELELAFSSKKENALPIFGFCRGLDINMRGLNILLKGFAEYLIKTDV